MNDMKAQDKKFMDGVATIVEFQGEAYLTVTRPQKIGKLVTVEEVRKEIVERKIININDKMLEVAVNAAIGGSIKITDDPDESDLAKLKQKRDRDGFAELTEKRDGLYLTVYRAEGKGKKLEYKEVESYLNKHGLTNVDYDLLKKTIEGAKGKAVKISGKSTKEAIEIAILEDGGYAQITLNSLTEDGIPVDVSLILKKLEKQGVIHGIDIEKIKELLDKKILGQPKVVTKRENAYAVEYLFEIPPKGKPQIIQDGNIDYYRHDPSLPSVKKGQTLVVKNLEKLARNVRGEKIKVEEADLKSIQGKNTIISRDRKSLKAAITGYAYIEEGKVCVERDSMVIKGNVEASMGEIQFEGNIFVTGCMLSGSRIRALGDIEIKGDVKRAKVISREGDVAIGGSVYGDQGEMEAANWDHVGTNPELSCSVISADYKLILRGGIIGGIAAGTWIAATSVGSRDHIGTRLMIGDAKTYEIVVESLELQEKIKMRSEALDSIRKELNTGKGKDLLREQMSNYLAIKKEQDDLKAKNRELKEMSIPKVTGWKIEVSDTLHPGVVISIEDKEIRISKALVNVTYLEDRNGRIETILG